MKGSALNAADLERCRATQARSIIILAMHSEGSGGAKRMVDADAIFMYKTVMSKYTNVQIVTELAYMSAVAYLVNEGDQALKKAGYYASKPFAAGEIYVGSLLDSLMCQAFY